MNMILLLSFFTLFASGARIQFGKLIGDSKFSTVEVEDTRIVGMLKECPFWLETNYGRIAPGVNEGHPSWQSFIAMELEGDLLKVSVNNAAHMILVRNRDIVYTHDGSFRGRQVKVCPNDYIIFVISNPLVKLPIVKTLHSNCVVSVGMNGPIDVLLSETKYYFDQFFVYLEEAEEEEEEGEEEGEEMTTPPAERADEEGTVHGSGSLSGTSSQIIITSEPDEPKLPKSSLTSPSRTLNRTSRSKSPRTKSPRETKEPLPLHPIESLMDYSGPSPSKEAQRRQQFREGRSKSELNVKTTKKSSHHNKKTEEDPPKPTKKLRLHRRKSTTGMVLTLPGSTEKTPSQRRRKSTSENTTTTTTCASESKSDQHGDK